MDESMMGVRRLQETKGIFPWVCKAEKKIECTWIGTLPKRTWDTGEHWTSEVDI